MVEHDDRRTGHGRSSADRARLETVAGLIESEPPGPSDTPGMIGRLQRLCTAAVHTIPVSGAGLSLMTRDSAGVVAAASSATSHQLEELQFQLGEGPCIEAYNTRRPTSEADLAGRGSRRWPAYAPAAQTLGARAVFAFPIHMGAARLGVLDLYRDRPGAMDQSAQEDGLTFAEIALQILLDGQDAAQQKESGFGLDEALSYRHVVYQAQGMVMVDLGVDLQEAMSRLRAHAFASGRDLTDLARDVVAGKVTLERDS